MSNNNRNIIFAALGGLVAGAVTGLLLAPGKGRETRDKIGKSARSISDSVSGGINTGVNKVSDLSRSVSGLFNRSHSEEPMSASNGSSNGNTARSTTKTTTTSSKS